MQTALQSTWVVRAEDGEACQHRILLHLASVQGMKPRLKHLLMDSSHRSITEKASELKG